MMGETLIARDARDKRDSNQSFPAGRGRRKKMDKNGALSNTKERGGN